MVNTGHSVPDGSGGQPKKKRPRLAFIHQSGPTLEEDGLRQVKSHVMQEYVRFRKQRQRTHVPARKGAHAKWQSGEDGSEDDIAVGEPVLILDPRVLITTTSSTWCSARALEDFVEQAEYGYTPIPDCGPENLRQTITELVGDPGDASTWFSEKRWKRTRRESPRDGYVTSSMHQMKDPQPPRDINKMLYMADAYLRQLSYQDCLAEHFSIYQRNNQTIGKAWCFDLSQSELVVFATCLLFHTFVSGESVITEKEALFWKGRTLRWLQDEIESSKGTVPNTTVCAGLCICASEIASQSATVYVHLRGLERMIQIRGGFTEPDLECTDFRPSILRILDTSQAICSNSEPLCSFLSEKPRLRVYTAAEAHGDFWNSSPLQMNGGFQFMSEHSELSHNLSTILLDAFHLTELRLTKPTDAPPPSGQQFPDPGIKIASIHARLKDFSATNSTLDNPTQIFLTESCRLAAWIHYRACAEHIPHHDPLNEQDVRTLALIMHKMTASVWMRMPYVYLWM